MQLYLKCLEKRGNLVEYRDINELLIEYKGNINVARFSKKEKCAVCYLTNVRKAIYECDCGTNKKICCSCYLKIVENKCPCCEKELNMNDDNSDSDDNDN